MIEDKVKPFVKIGEKLPYRNTAQKICWAEITEIKEEKSGYWFKGIDIKTKASVWYSLKQSKLLLDFASDFAKKYHKERVEAWTDERINALFVLYCDGDDYVGDYCSRGAIDFKQQLLKDE